MSQLADLLHTLTPQELTTVKALKLRGKEKEVFDKTLQNLNSPDTENSIEDLTSTHLYKIQSVLLQKSYAQLVPNLGLELLRFLIQKNLFVLFRYELTRQEKLIKQKKDTTHLQEYYLRSFHMLIDLPFKYYNKKLLDEFGEKYIKSNPAFGEAEKQYVFFHKLFSWCNLSAARKNLFKYFDTSHTQLKEYEQQLEHTDFYLAKYYLYRTFCSYYNYYEWNPELLLSYLQKAIDLKNYIAYFFPINIGVFLELTYADTLYATRNIDEAYAKYKLIFENGVTSDIYGYYYHCEQFAQLLILKKDFETAESFISKHFKNVIEQQQELIATRGCLTFAKLYLSHNKLNEAKQYINKAQELNEKSCYMPFDMQLRTLECFYFIKKGDYDFAAHLSIKNVKYIESQGEMQKFGYYLDLFKCMEVLSKTKLKNLPITEETKKQLQTIDGQAILYCDLINQLANL